MSSVHRFYTGQRVIVTKFGNEKGRIVERCDRIEWDWWVQHAFGSPVPYKSTELVPLQEITDDTPDVHPFDSERLERSWDCQF